MPDPGLSVLHLSTFDIVGGASRAAYRLHSGLRQLGIASRMLVRQKSGDDPDVLLAGRVPEPRWHRAWRKAAPYLDELPQRLLKTDNPTPISPAWVASPVAGDVRRLAPKVVNLHWICGGFVPPSALSRLPAPLVWTLHDQWPFCGGEHFTADERRPREGYGAGNRSPGEGGVDVNRWVWARKQRAYRRTRQLTIVAPSRWLADLAGKSALLKDRRVVHIPYGIDADRFHPVERALARRMLGLPAEKRILLFGAFGGINNPRKNFALLAASLRRLAAAGPLADTELVIFGSGEAGLPADLGIPVRSLGVLHDDISLCLAYAAADLYVSTSLADNLPLTVAEAMACGTPVIALASGGIGDLVRDGETGFLVEAAAPEAFAAALETALTDGERRAALGSGARQLIERDFTIERQAERYAALYREITDAPC